jgi:3-mercaptopyruvate sulfurtransferase SseA
MRRSVFTPAVLALAAAAAALLGACKATDTAGNVSTGAVASKAGAKPNGAESPRPPTGTTTVHADGIRRVSVAELQKMVEAGTVAIYDTRSKMSYDAEHIKGALSLPEGEADARAAELPRDKTLVFYCT